jgi:hypothetical protein
MQFVMSSFFYRNAGRPPTATGLSLWRYLVNAMDKVEDAVAGKGVEYILPFPSVGHQPDIPEDRQMLGDCRYIGPDLFSKIADTGFAFCKAKNQEESRGMGQGFENSNPAFVESFVIDIHSIWYFYQKLTVCQP